MNSDMIIENGVLVDASPTTGLVVIPDGVTKIGEGAFYGSHNVMKVVIPDSVKSIEFSAFKACSTLTSVVIGNGLESIGPWAFDSCYNLTSINIPDSVTSIGQDAFANCLLLNYEIVGGVKYLGKWAIDASNDFIANITLRDGTIGIAGTAFECSTYIKSITIPDSVKTIGAYAFRHCIGLKSITIPDSVTSIEKYAFQYCYGLTSITIPDNLKRIEWYTFEECHSLKSKVANYKAFNITSFGKLKCLDKTYKEGRKSSVRGELRVCHNGIHYCTNLYEIFDYYYGELDKDIAIYECDVSDENIGQEYSSKRCARWIIPRKRLYREDIIRILNGGE